MADGYITIETKLDTKSFDKQIESLVIKANELEDMLKEPKKLGLSSKDIKETEVELEKTKNKIIQLRNEKDKLNQSGGFESINKSLKSSVTQAGRLVLAIFGVRSAYMALRQASSELASYDKQYATNLEYIRYALTQAIAPVLVWIVNLASKVLQIVAMIVNALFGINIFGKASAKNFQKMKAGAGGASKAVKEIRKQLAGFDEMNILQDDKSSSGGGAGGGGVSMPEFDLSKLQGEPPAWLKWIVDNRALILGILAGILAFIVAMKLGLGFITSLGIGIMVAGIIMLIQDLIAFLKDPTWENFGKMLKDFGIIIIGLGVIMGSWLIIAIGVVTAIVGFIITHWDTIKVYLAKFWEWLKNLGTTIWNGVVDVMSAIQNWIVSVVLAIWNGIVAICSGIQNWFYNNVFKPIGNFFKKLWDDMINGLKNAINSAKNAFNNLKNIISTIFSAILNMFKTLGGKVADIVSGALKAVINGTLTLIENVMNTPINAINSLLDVINAVPGINLSKLNTFNLPRLKVGGIINMPNKGVMLGSAIGGESGAEGVIPLTDEQAMETLGEAIGKYITINASIVNSMNGKVLSRELKRIDNRQEFAYNS